MSTLKCGRAIIESVVKNGKNLLDSALKVTYILKFHALPKKFIRSKVPRVNFIKSHTIQGCILAR